MPKAEVLSGTADVARDPIKCVVWDLDGTLWSGIMLEGGAQQLTPGVEDIVRALDQRGILQSVASKNDHDQAWQQLEALGISEFFLHPQINWDSKAKSVETIARRLNIGLDAIAFVDDQPAERDEVSHFHPQVWTIAPDQLPTILEAPRLKPRFTTSESHRRRSMYRADIERDRAEEDFDGKRDEFLGSLGMVMTIRTAEQGDLERAEELTVRTNQLNTTSQTYSYDDLCALMNSDEHLVLVAQLDDRYGSSGTIGLALIHMGAEAWTIKLLIMSCRVVSRGVGSVFLTHILQRAKAAGVVVRALYKRTERNRQILITLRFAGFQIVEGSDLLEHDLQRLPKIPHYVDVRTAG